MEISLSLFIICSIIFYFILYVVIETAVRRGIDSSKTNEMIGRIYEKINKEH
ncbi:hypothetical protein A21D_00462 [Virgibacillus dokdonensis]|uniref:Uncharacterized protein n=1 Tax=Virgibacillus dokdonensis TaxID=302167 RepID=A0A2K9IVS6_9BACI|nr:hypothetical protein A21D_00462 [Virgibacillus dokdonensis]